MEPRRPERGESVGAGQLAARTARHPTPDERGKERSVAFALVTDTAVIVPLVIVALATGSLTLVADRVRGVLMWGLSLHLLLLMRAVHRGRLSRFEFGAAKLEHLSSALFGFGLLLGGIWVAQNMVHLLAGERPPASPLGLAVAAVVNAVNALINVVNWLVVRAAASRAQSEIFRAQLHGRRLMLVSSLILQATLTGAVLAQDPLASLCLDAGGAAVVSLLLFRNGFRLWGRALPVLLDARAPRPVRAAIIAELRRVLPGLAILSLRTRSDGEGWIAEVSVAARSAARVLDAGAWREPVEAALGRAGHAVRLSIAVAPEAVVPGGSFDEQICEPGSGSPALDRRGASSR